MQATAGGLIISRQIEQSGYTTLFRCFFFGVSFLCCERDRFIIFFTKTAVIIKINAFNRFLFVSNKEVYVYSSIQFFLTCHTWARELCISPDYVQSLQAISWILIYRRDGKF